MATSIIRDDVFIWSNLLTASVVFQALTWVFQIMPLFFFAGVAACVDTWHPGTSWGNWLMRRCTRLYRPVFYYLAFWVSALAVLRYFLPEHVYEPVAGISSSCCGSSAPTSLCWRPCRCWRASPPPAGCSAPSQRRMRSSRWSTPIRINVDGPSASGLPEPGRLVDPRHARRRLPPHASRRARGADARRRDARGQCGAAGAGPYELSLVGIETQQLKNMTPPSLLLAGHAIMMCAFAIAAAPAIARWAQRPRVWWLTAIGNSGAMTLYLWHIPPLFGLHLVRRPAAIRGSPELAAGSAVGGSSRRSAHCCAWPVRPRWRRSAGASRARGCTASR